MNQQFARLNDITSSKGKPGRYPVSPATWWRWVSSGYAPPGLRLGPNTTAWSLASLEEFDKKIAAGVPSEEVHSQQAAPAHVEPAKVRMTPTARRKLAKLELA